MGFLFVSNVGFAGLVHASVQRIFRDAIAFANASIIQLLLDNGADANGENNVSAQFQRHVIVVGFTP